MEAKRKEFAAAVAAHAAECDRIEVVIKFIRAIIV